MKRITKTLLAFVFAVGAAFAFAGCGEISASETLPAAAETAVQSEQKAAQSTYEWLLYEEACADGYEGSFFEFLQEAGIPLSDDTAAINLGLTSAVCVESTFGTGNSASYSAGSGVIWSLDTASGDAYVVTNYHVIFGQDKSGSYEIARSVSLYLYGGYQESRAISAAYYGGDMNKDVAVLKVTGSALLQASKNPVYAKAVKVGEGVSAGERVYAIGNPDAQGFSVTGGVVSVPYETIDILRADDRVTITLPEIRIDAAINHGNSGGGLFNAKGELVGIVNARYEGEAALGYALPIETVKAVVERTLAS